MAGVLILVQDKENPGRMELAEFADPHEAEQYVEELLANGVPQEVIRAFSAVELEMQVSHRPVVSLGDSQAAPPAAETPGAAEGESPPADEAGEAVAAAQEAGDAQPFVRDGVRFSSLFRSDSGFEPV